MEVDVYVESGATALDRRHRTALRVWQAKVFRPTSLHAQQSPMQHRQHRATKAMIEDHPESQSMGDRQYILTHWQSPQNPINEIGRPFVHAPSSTARTHSTAFARKRNQMLGRTTVTAKAGKSPGQKSAGQKLAQLTLQKGGQRCTAASSRELTQEGLQMLADHAVQDTYVRFARAVGEVRRCRHTHAGSEIHADRRPRES